MLSVGFETLICFVTVWDSEQLNFICNNEVNNNINWDSYEIICFRFKIFYLENIKSIKKYCDKNNTIKVMIFFAQTFARGTYVGKTWKRWTTSINICTWFGLINCIGVIMKPSLIFLQAVTRQIALCIIYTWTLWKLCSLHPIGLYHN